MVKPKIITGQIAKINNITMIGNVDMSTCKKCFVSGRVQGVFFRETTRQQAVKLQLTGYAKNLTDGRVEVIACGSESSVNELCEWLWKGSDYSYVSDVQCQEIEVDEHEKSNLFATM